jgi:hypothetical protein
MEGSDIDSGKIFLRLRDKFDPSVDPQYIELQLNTYK